MASDSTHYILAEGSTPSAVGAPSSTDEILAAAAQNDNNTNIWRDFTPADREEYQRLTRHKRLLKMTVLPMLLTILTLMGVKNWRIRRGQADCVYTYNTRKFGEHARCKDAVSRFLNLSVAFLLPVVSNCLILYYAYVNRQMEGIVQRTAGATQNLHIPIATAAPNNNGAPAVPSLTKGEASPIPVDP